jgi:hypothetical protein
LTNKAISIPPRVPAIGIVKIHAVTRRPTRCQLTALIVPLQRPTPTVAPVMHIEVDTGSEYCEKRRTVIAAPISIEQPLLGEWYVSLLPMTVKVMLAIICS